ncbi:MAG TPA: DUF2530 domain-containing protein, partial [Microbacteriaceae bacterium]
MAKIFVPHHKRKPDPEPVKTNPQGVLLLGTLVWLFVLVIILSFFDSLSSAGFGWWLYTAIVGVSLGVI